ncbi:MAG: SH3 domain-containing protein [Roseicyclus sp.]
MIRLTLILAVVIFAVLVLVPHETEVTGTGPGPAGTTAAPPTGPEPGDDQALREGPDGRLVLRTATGEDLPIDLVVEPADLAQAERGADAPAAAVSGAQPPAPETAEAEAEAPAPAPDGATRLRVTGDRVNLRAGPSTGNEVLAALTLGTEVELIERVADGWAHLRVPDTGLTGYMSGDFLEPAN